MANHNNPTYGISQETAEKALLYMKAEGYMEPSDTTEDLIDYTRSMVEGIPFMVRSKITQWAQRYEWAQNEQTQNS